MSQNQSSKKWNPKLDHVAIAVKDIQKLKKVLELIGLQFDGLEKVETEGVCTHFYKFFEVQNTQIEILEPIKETGSVAKFLEKKGGGIHHISIRVDNLEELLEFLKQHQIRLVYENPRLGAHNTKINFIHPESTGGVLIELSSKV
jgi:methylmalonyl-CoA epimerase